MAATIPSIACLGVIGRNGNPLHMTVFPSYDAASNSMLPVRNSLQFSLMLCGTLDVFSLRSAARSSLSATPATASVSSAAGLGGASDAAGVMLLHALDDRLAAYGCETNTGVKLVAVVDMRGRPGNSGRVGAGMAGAGAGVGPGTRTSIGTAGTAGGSSSATAAAAAGDRSSVASGASVGGSVLRGSGGATSSSAAASSALTSSTVGLREADMKPVFKAMQTAYVRLLQNPFYDPDEHSPLGGHGGKKISSQRFGRDMQRIGEAWVPGVASL